MSSHPHQDLAYAIVAGTPAIATCFVALRIAARRWAKIPLDLSDYLIMVATALSLLLIWPTYRNIHMWHIGIHVWDIPFTDLEPDYDEYHKVILAFNLIHTPILPIVKVSIILLLLKIGKVITAVRRALYGILIFTIAACIGPWIALIFVCPPRTGNTWAPTVYGMRCIGGNRGNIIVLTLVTINMVTDLLIFPIPLILMRSLQKVSLRARFTIGFLFALSLGATAVGAIRLKIQWNIQLYHEWNADWTYNITLTLQHVENNLAIVIACIPPLRTLILRWSSKPDVEQQPQAMGQSTFANQRIGGESLLFITTPEQENGEKVESKSALADNKNARPHAHSLSSQGSSQKDEKATVLVK